MHLLPAAISSPLPQPEEVGGTQSKHVGIRRALWAHTREKVPQLACCPDLLRLVLEGGGESVRPLVLSDGGATFVGGPAEERPT